MKKLLWNLNKNSYIFIQENAFMADILSQTQCVYIETLPQVDMPHW